METSVVKLGSALSLGKQFHILHKEVYYTDAVLSFAKRFHDNILMQNSGCQIIIF